jgi:hypothetical protein
MAGKTTTAEPTLTMQGIEVPRDSVNPQEFFKRTRRQRFQLAAAVGAFAGLGNTDAIEFRKTGILASVDIHFTGSLTITLGGGTAATTTKWPYDLLKTAFLTANGQSALINCGGSKLKARQMMSQPGLTDRGIPQGVTGASPGTTVYNGTLSLASESWGVGQAVTGIAAASYPVDLTWRIPIAWDNVKLLGALFLQTSATSVDLSILWAPVTDLFTLTGAATAVLTGGWYAEGIVFTIPQVNGNIVVPDLSVFHTMTQSNYTALGQTQNLVTLAGQGVGKQLMRIFGQVYTGATGPGAVLPFTAANYGQVGWGYGGTEQPEIYTDGMALRRLNEEQYGVDIGGTAGFFAIDFANHWAFRDSVNEGDATELRIILTILAALTNPRLEYVQETIVSGATGS